MKQLKFSREQAEHNVSILGAALDKVQTELEKMEKQEVGGRKPEAKPQTGEREKP